jgi:steroid delta-isomerase-like uncharacterized protein
MTSRELIESYYAHFNDGNYEGMLALLTDDVLHEPSQGEPRLGKELFREFLAHMDRCYKEEVHEPEIMVSSDGTRAAAEFMLTGSYLVTDSELPSACGQHYRLRVGAFFDIRSGSIARVSNHYNLQNWLLQISAR